MGHSGTRVTLNASTHVPFGDAQAELLRAAEASPLLVRRIDLPTD